MTFPVRFVTIAICVTFIACAMIREYGPIYAKLLDLRILTTIHEIQEGLKHLGPSNFKV